MMNDGKITTLIVDDNLAAIQLLASAIERNYSATMRIVATATNSREAEALIDAHRPDLLFLDVELPDICGLDYARELRRRVDWPMKIVIYTSYDHYLIGALRVNAFDFLLKPLSESELATVVSRYVNARAEDAAMLERDALSAAAPEADGSAKPLLITTNTNDKIVLRRDSIGLFKYDNDRKRWEVKTSGGESYQLFGQTTAETILAYGPEFVRIHRTYIININYLAAINDSLCQMLPPFDSVEELRVSKNFRKELVDRFYSI